MSNNTFVTAVTSIPQEVRTENGMKTLNSSMSALVDLFFSAGASRGKDLSTQFARAYAEDSTLALRMLLWIRDVRGGAGEREVVRKILLNLEKTNPKALARILPHLAEFGRWDDLLIFTSKEVKAKAFTMIGDAIRKGQMAKQLLAKIDSMSEEECAKILSDM